MTLALPDDWRSLPTEEKQRLAFRAQELLKAGGSASFRAFQRKYWDDPAGFARDCFAWKEGQGPTAYQCEVMAGLLEYKRYAVRGPHSLGKTFTASIIILWFALTRDGRDWKIITTATGWNHLSKYLWPEVHKWVRRIRWDVIGREPFIEKRELLDLAIKLRTGQASAVASNDPIKIEGAHADHLLYVCDEAKGIPDATWDAIEGAFTGTGSDTEAEGLQLAISTPGNVSGRFYEIHQRAPGHEDWKPRHVKVDEAIEAGRVSVRRVEQQARLWGEESAIYQNRVLGEFASQDEDSVIPLSWVEAANERWREKQSEVEEMSLVESPFPPSITRGKHSIRGLPIEALGVDIADGGPDRSKAALRSGSIITEMLDITVAGKNQTMKVVGKLVALARLFSRSSEAVSLVVDVIGNSVVSRLLELADEGKLPDDVKIVPFNASEGTPTTDESGELRFLNKRSAGWWGLRERLDPSSGDGIALPPDDKLTGDLTAPTWSLTSSGRIKIEAKESIKKRIGRSTDDADAVIHAFWREPVTSGSKTIGIPAGISMIGGASIGSDS